MEYLIGVALGASTAGLAHLLGFDRPRNFYPVLLIVIASYYVLFAVMAGSAAALSLEVIIFGGWMVGAVIGFRFNLWVAVVGLIGHGLFDALHGGLIANSGVPVWWPGFCLAFDLVFGAYAAGRILARDTGRAPVSEWKEEGREQSPSRTLS